MSLADAKSALVVAYQAAMPDVPTRYDMLDFTPPVDTAWNAFSFIPADNNAVTLGDAGEDEDTGYIQIVLYDVENVGDNGLLSRADTLKHYFKNGRGFIYNGQLVNVNRSRVTPIRYAGGYANQVIQFFWRARSKRNP